MENDSVVMTQSALVKIASFSNIKCLDKDEHGA